MKRIHTNACGTEPYDKTYSLGYEVHHKDWSPFSRVNHLRQTFLDRPYEIDVERLRLVTEAYEILHSPFEEREHDQFYIRSEE